MFDKEDRQQIKESLRQYSLLRDKVFTVSEDHRYLDVGGEFLSIGSTAFYQNYFDAALPFLSGSDTETDSHFDSEIDQSMFFIYQMVLNHLDFLANKDRIKY